jgi:hypothetical protein
MFNPRGGVISPASIMRTAITPNRMGSNPSFNMVGNMTGRVSAIMELALKIMNYIMLVDLLINLAKSVFSNRHVNLGRFWVSIRNSNYKKSYAI